VDRTNQTLERPPHHGFGGDDLADCPLAPGSRAKTWSLVGGRQRRQRCTPIKLCIPLYLPFCEHDRDRRISGRCVPGAHNQPILLVQQRSNYRAGREVTMGTILVLSHFVFAYSYWEPARVQSLPRCHSSTVGVNLPDDQCSCSPQKVSQAHWHGVHPDDFVNLRDRLVGLSFSLRL
jgi:hypothetical protein